MASPKEHTFIASAEECVSELLPQSRIRENLEKRPDNTQAAKDEASKAAARASEDHAGHDMPASMLQKSLSTYKYKPLDENKREIRYLTLLPGKWDDEIEVTLTHFALGGRKQREPPVLDIEAAEKLLPTDWSVYKTIEDDRLIYHCHENDKTSWSHPNPAYVSSTERKSEADDEMLPFEALSYTWGYVGDDCSIKIRENAVHHLLRVRRNLFEALRQLRYDGNSRTLWIDAICVDQNDLDERSSQVSYMSTIYSFAARVFVWLGPEHDDSDLAMKALQDLGEQVEVMHDRFLTDAPGCVEPKWGTPSCSIPYDSRTWDSIRALIERPWFRRLWVVQEVQLAGRGAIIMCGSHCVTWYAIRRAIVCIIYNDGPELLDLQQALNNSGAIDLALNAQHLNIDTLLVLAGTRLCSDPKDLVYGILAMQHPRIALSIKVDYSLPVGEVYWQTFVAACSTSKGRLGPLGLITIDAVSGRQQAALQGLPDVAYSCPSGNSSAAASLGRPDRAGVKGVQCTSVRTVFPLGSETGLPVQETFDRCLQWYEVFKGRKCLTLEDVENDFAQNICFGDVSERFVDLEGSNSTLRWKETLIGELRELHELPRRNELFLQTKLSRRALISFDNGTFGIGPPSTQPGDTLCTLLGEDENWLFRPSGEHAYNVIGRCYTHHLSTGEALLGPLPHPWTMIIRYTSRTRRYRNLDTGEERLEDPRLGSLPSDWEFACEGYLSTGSHLKCNRYKNRVTGEVMESDPRMLPEALEERGIRLKTFYLVPPTPDNV